ncbi:MAG: hypothetical protein OQJ81_09135 [Melioribacteraceae bacterium]|nr:hypothetical protein [Melioribacteraceae bacterium]
MRNIKFIFSLLFIVFAAIACEEGNDVIYVSDAKLVWTGKYDNGGCGYFIEVDSIMYKPENEGIIPPDYRKAEPLSITVQYIELQYEIEYYCGDTPNPQKSEAIKLTYMDLNEELPD